MTPRTALMEPPEGQCLQRPDSQGRSCPLPLCLPPAPRPAAPRLEDPWVSAADFETLRQDPDSVSRKFYEHFSEDVTELSRCVMIWVSLGLPIFAVGFVVLYCVFRFCFKYEEFLLPSLGSSYPEPS